VRGLTLGSGGKEGAEGPLPVRVEDGWISSSGPVKFLSVPNSVGSVRIRTTRDNPEGLEETRTGNQSAG